MAIHNQPQITFSLCAQKKEIEKPSERTYNEAILYGSALNDIKILCKGSLWYCKRCLSLDESLVCVNEKSSTKKSGKVKWDMITKNTSEFTSKSRKR